MVLSNFITPFLAISGSIMLLTIALQLRLDHRRSREEQRTHRHIIRRARTQNAKRITVIIELSRTANTIIPLLDDLQKQAYRKLEVIVVIKHTAGKYAPGKLRQYRRTQAGNFRLRLITHRKGLDRLTITKRMATGEALLWLPADHRLSDDFFVQASFALLDPAVDAIVPQRRVIVTKTLTSAWQAVIQLWRDVSQALPATSTPVPGAFQDGIVYRRSAVLRSAPLRPTPSYSGRLCIAAPARPWRATRHSRSSALRHRSVVYLAVGITLVGSGIVAGLTISQWQLLALIAGGAYWALYSCALMAIPGYTASQRLNLFLLGPASVGFLLLYTLTILVTRCRDLFRRVAPPRPTPVLSRR